MALYKWNVRIAGIGSFPDQIQYMSQDDYNAMSESEKMNGTTYGIVGTAETPDPSLTLKFEFVEKKTVTGKDWLSIWTYSFDTFVIAKSTITSWFQLAYNNNGSAQPWYEVQPAYMDTCFFKSWTPISLDNPRWKASDTFEIWIYKINLPEE